MPYARSKDTAAAWVQARKIALWVWFSSDLEGLESRELEQFHRSLRRVRDAGARCVQIVNSAVPEPERLAGPDSESWIWPGAPTPTAIWRAMDLHDHDDVRTVGVIGTSSVSLEAAQRAGAGAVIGMADPDTDRRRQLVRSQPDHIVAAHGFAELDARRYATTRRPKEAVLLNPGPAITTDRIHRAVGGPDLCHREPDYTELFGDVRTKLLRAAGVGDDWAVVLLAGSGTAAMEAMTIAAVRPGRTLLVCRNGIYGERIETIAHRAGIETVVVSAPDLEPIDPTAVAAMLDADPAIDAVAVVHHETTTGLLNPVHEIAALTAERDMLLLCDAISSLGAEELDLAAGGIDIVASTSNKCLHGLPGCAFLLVSPRGQRRIEEVPPRSLYFDLAAYLRAQSKRTVPFTPAIPALYGLDAALDELFDEGVAERKAVYRTRMAYLDDALAALGLEARVAPAHRSRSVRSLPLPPGMDYATLHDRMKDAGYVIYAGLGDAAATTFRVCALGALSVETLEGFVETLQFVLAEHAPEPEGTRR